MSYGFQFDFDEEGEPPKVYIAEGEGRGTAVLEVFEEPTCVAPKWSWEDADWRAGPLAMKVLEALNGENNPR